MCPDVLLRLAVLTGEGDYARRATATLRPLREVMAHQPMGFGRWLAALDFYLATPKEIALVGPLNDPATQALLGVVYSRYLPNKLVAGQEMDSSADDGIPLLQGKVMLDGHPTAYVCEQYACQTPVTDAETLAGQLAG